MDIITAHQHGLIEQLELEAAAIAGRGKDYCQRAVVLHHLFDHSRGTHRWALAEGRRQLRIIRGIDALTRKLDRWGWLYPRREQAKAALEQLAAALGDASQLRCTAAYFAYRLSATPALREEAEQRLPPQLLLALESSHQARRAGESAPVEQVANLESESESHADAAADVDVVQAAWAAIGATWLRRSAERWLGPRRLARGDARDRKRGLIRVERELRDDPLLPAGFRANPAQHFYALQLAQAERRRQQWREACDREPGSFELAA